MEWDEIEWGGINESLARIVGIKNGKNRKPTNIQNPIVPSRLPFSFPSFLHDLFLAFSLFLSFLLSISLLQLSNFPINDSFFNKPISLSSLPNSLTF